MIKQSGLLRWNNRQYKQGNRQWIHPPDAIQMGQIAYQVKFLGHTEVEQAKGVDVVKEGIRKLKFSQQLRRSEGIKIPKVELAVSIDGVTVLDPKSKRVIHQYPLHRISYCADDKSDKKFFCFIAKEADADNHTCFVFVSDKLAEEITLTIGQAFDQAYRRFLETSGRDMTMRKQMMVLQKKCQELETENFELKRTLDELQQPMEQCSQQRVTGISVVNGEAPSLIHGITSLQSARLNPLPLLVSASNGPQSNMSLLPIPPRTSEKKDKVISPSQELFEALAPLTNAPVVGSKLENLALDDLEDFNPREESQPICSAVNGIPAVANGSVSPGQDLFGAGLLLTSTSCPQSPDVDPFGMGDFNPSELGATDLESAIGDLDKKINEMRDGFRRGLTFGKDVFPLEDLDPLVNKTVS